MLRIGIFDHLSRHLGGGQLVVAHIAAQLSRFCQVEVIHGGNGYSLEGLADAFEVDLSLVRERIFRYAPYSFGLPGSQTIWKSLPKSLWRDHQLTSKYDVFIYSGHGVPPFCFAGRGIIYSHFPFESNPNQTLKNALGWEKRTLIDRRLRLAIYEWMWNWRMGGYQKILSNSEFTASWIRQRWEKSTEVLYPPVALKTSLMDKKNIIVSIGRFVHTAGKNHDLQLKVFEQLCSAMNGDIYLYMIGFCADIREDQIYVESLRNIAKNSPVKIMINAERTVVRTHLAQAKVFWHTTGLGEVAEGPPDRAEHFGIATVEAMGAGCVPIVPLGGGQPEIVEHGRNGFLCRSGHDLLQFTSILLTDHVMWANMSRQARTRAQDFAPDIFENQLYQHVFGRDSQGATGQIPETLAALSNGLKGLK